MREDKTDAKALLRIMDSASKISLHRELARKILSGEEREYLKGVITSMASGVGDNLSETDIDKAVTNYLENVHIFTQPRNSFQVKLAEAYINREKIGKRYGIPTLAVIGSGLLIAGGISAGGRIVERINSNNLEHTRTNLEYLFGSIREENPPKIMMQEAESVYKNGLLSLIENDLRDSRISEEELKVIKAKVDEFLILPGELEATYADVVNIAKESDVKAKADLLYSQGSIFVKTAQLDSLHRTVQEMQNLEAILNQQYTLTIVNKPDVKSGIDRYFTDASGKRVSGFYLIVEAISPDGKIIPQEIKSEQNGDRAIVKMWGERVPRGVYEQVKEDKIDNGIIENDTFGRKSVGYLNPKITFTYNGVPLERGGQILRW
jgi:hypothetical protein